MRNITLMKAAREGIFTREMEDVLRGESIGREELLEKLANGKIVIPANIYHTNIRGIGIGEGLKTKINVNLGVSEDCYNTENEMLKVKKALEYKADSIMDLSIFGDTRNIRRKIVSLSDVMIGTVPMYDAVAKYGKNIKDITVDDLFKVVEDHAIDGIDFMTIHAGLTRTAVERVEKNKRLTYIVSRGGSILYEWIKENDKENPFYEHYDRLLELCAKYDVTLSLGDALRPGSIHDATDSSQVQELIFLGELTREAWKKDVQVMIEGPGHVPLNEIEANVKLQKKICSGAPFYVLGPLVTDIAPGYDHITSAIGGAVAGAAGADFLCYVTPAEHLRLPDLDDMKEGIMASRIAAHAADIAKGIKGANDIDNKMSKARANLDWEGMYQHAIDPEKARRYRESVKTHDSDVCSMCGDMCAVKRSKAVYDKNN